ncbi:Non-specific lipid-transfer protein [Holothuria leucospilota]|uniref:Non-specific lipid-transfer protein n=1 Tax=Holothuria leucospilota TaxID=206669 RepID=A0A9Q1C7B6_HOLLE|nr:Non-specific lipid-transfer protein [Holothuria leucospilota]
MADLLSSNKKGSVSKMRPALQLKLTTSEAFESEAFFKMIEETLRKEGPALVKKVNAVFAFNVTDGPNGKKEKWLIDVKNGNGSVRRGAQGRADTTFTMKDKDIVKLMKGTLQPQPAFFAGKLKVSGNMGIALKLQQIIPKVPQAKL